MSVTTIGPRTPPTGFQCTEILDSHGHSTWYATCCEIWTSGNRKCYLVNLRNFHSIPILDRYNSSSKASDMGREITPGTVCNCVTGPCNCGTFLPPPGMIYNTTNGQQYLQNARGSIYPAGHYIDSQGNEWDYDGNGGGPLTQPGVIRPFKNPPTRLPGFHFMPTRHQNAVPITAIGVDPDEPATTTSATVSGDEDLFLGFSPTTWLWIGGGAAAVVLAATVLPAAIKEAK